MVITKFCNIIPYRNYWVLRYLYRLIFLSENSVGKLPGLLIVIHFWSRKTKIIILGHLFSSSIAFNLNELLKRSGKYMYLSLTVIAQFITKCFIFVQYLRKRSFNLNFHNQRRFVCLNNLIINCSLFQMLSIEWILGEKKYSRDWKPQIIMLNISYSCNTWENVL